MHLYCKYFGFTNLTKVDVMWTTHLLPPINNIVKLYVTIIKKMKTMFYQLLSYRKDNNLKYISKKIIKILIFKCFVQQYENIFIIFHTLCTVHHNVH